MAPLQSPPSPTPRTAAPLSARDLKTQGQKKARKHAGSAWLAKTLAQFKEFCLEAYIHGKKEVSTEDFRKLGVAEEPASDNAWGSLPAAARKAGFIAQTSMVKQATRPLSHGRLIRLWHINPEGL